MDATYTPDDNKLRLYTFSRLDHEDYLRARGAGFRWAPKQDLFVCPAWTPEAEDLCLEWCGEIDDEDTTLADRAADRSERFEGYSGKRAAESAEAYQRVDTLAGGIPLGQPILVGHHSEKRARRDAKRIDDGMRKAVRLWETSEYWERRAAGVLRSANYKALPTVRARRIKKLEAERRSWTRRYDANGKTIMQEAWGNCRGADGEHEHGYEERCEKCESQPHIWCGDNRSGCWTPVRLLPEIEAHARRWVAHIDRRLAYERTLLEADGGLALLEPKKRPKLPPIRNYRGPGGVIRVRNTWTGEIDSCAQADMTKSELAKLHSDYKGTSLSEDGSHRVRTVARRGVRTLAYLTDSKDHGAPA